MSTNLVENTAEAYSATEQTSQTVENTADQSVAASLGLNTQLFAFQFLNFAIVSVILWFLILKPLIKKMEERKNIIDDSLDKAKEIETKLQMSEQVYQEKIDEAKVSANKVLEDTYKKSEEMAIEMKDNAKMEIEQLVKQAKSKIEAEKNAMIEGVKNNSVELVMLAVEKIIREKMDSSKDKEIIEEALKNLKK
ncbi:MAG: F0F1 ATP synthase subunit B [Candidatus Magasanikbacteria bacterium]|nr:F0F1 ATP synthase subunit B [Candidatus Magasanikbacteria bacterium]